MLLLTYFPYGGRKENHGLTSYEKAINHHEYSCDMTITKTNIQRLWADFGNKPVFVGEIGCGGTPKSQAAYLQAFADWAYTEPK